MPPVVTLQPVSPLLAAGTAAPQENKQHEASGQQKPQNNYLLINVYDCKENCAVLSSHVCNEL